VNQPALFDAEDDAPPVAVQPPSPPAAKPGKRQPPDLSRLSPDARTLVTEYCLDADAVATWGADQASTTLAARRFRAAGRPERGDEPNARERAERARAAAYLAAECQRGDAGGLLLAMYDCLFALTPSELRTLAPLVVAELRAGEPQPGERRG
jgi:pyruvate/2-oxoglutarate dehydrogenase complex dihydrolipoamide acyltransferase (E2) component